MSSLQTSPPTSHARPADQGTSTATLLDLRRSRWTPRKRRCGPGGVLSAEHQTSSKEVTVYAKCHPDHTNARATPQTLAASPYTIGTELFERISRNSLFFNLNSFRDSFKNSLILLQQPS